MLEKFNKTEPIKICPVSSITGQGFDVFYEALKELVNTIEPKKNDGIFRLPVERVFSVKGYGTVVSGIPVSGFINVGDEVTLFPHDIKGRIKAIQVYKRQSDTAMVGQCAALNISQWDYKTIKRGCCVTLGEYFKPQQLFLCNLRILDNIKSPLKNGMQVRFHTGTSEVVATILLLKGSNISAGQNGFVQVRLNPNDQIVSGPRDRFILRSLSPVQTLGGGMIIEALSHKLKRNQPDIIQKTKELEKAVNNDKDFVEYAIRTAKDFAVNQNELSVRTKILPRKMDKILAELIEEDKILNLDSKLFIHKNIFSDVQNKLSEIVKKYHAEKPQSPGITIDQLLEASGMKKDVFDGLLKLLLSQGELIEKKHCIALPEHREKFSDDEQKLIDSIESLFTQRLFNPPNQQEIIEHTKATLEKIQKIVKILAEQERLVRVEKELYFHKDAVEKAREILISYINEQGGLESVKFKYLLNTSRKFAIPLLDYFDKIGLTRRSGYTRYLRNPKTT